MAGGLEKAYSLLGALKTGLVTILVTDEKTAAAVLEARREDEAGTIERSIARLFDSYGNGLRGGGMRQAPGGEGRYLAGIDLGSTSLKSVIYDLRGNVVASGSRTTERFHPDTAHPDWTVWDPAQIWGGAAASIKDAVTTLDDPRRIAAVSVTGMGMDGVPIDEDGKWLYPFISWLCPRTEPQRQWWEKTIGARKTFSIGGNNLWAFSTALRLLWMAEHEPQILRRTHKWLLIEDFLNYMLCGRLATDYSMASCTLLFDQAARSWSREMLGLSGIDGRLALRSGAQRNHSRRGDTGSGGGNRSAGRARPWCSEAMTISAGPSRSARFPREFSWT